MRRSQRILNKSKKKSIDLNDFCLCNLNSSCIDKVNNKRKRKYVDKTGLEIKATQDVLPTVDLGQVHPTFIRKQIEIPCDKRQGMQHDVPLDLSKKSKESINKTSKADIIPDLFLNLKEETYAFENKIPKGKYICDFLMSKLFTA